MKRTRLKKKLNSLRRTRCHWCQITEKLKPIETTYSAQLQKR